MLADALRDLGWTGGEFALRLGVHRNTVSAWLSGKTPVPAYCEAYLSLALDVKRLAATLEK